MRVGLPTPEKAAAIFGTGPKSRAGNQTTEEIVARFEAATKREIQRERERAKRGSVENIGDIGASVSVIL